MTDRRNYLVDTIAGDGIGPEVVAPTIRCLDALAERFDFEIRWRKRDWGSDYYRAHGRMMPVDALDQLADGDAVLLGAVGDPDIPDHETLWGLLIPIRRTFDQYANVRPVRLLPGLRSPLRDVTELDIVVVRENTEGEYSSVGGRISAGDIDIAAVQQALFTRNGIDRITRYAAELAGKRSGRLISATKSNGIIHTMPFWDEIVAEVVNEYPAVQLESVLIDALAARLVLKPQSVDVIVGSNLFGDILSDLTAAISGSVGVAPSANINPERRHPSMFEPIHGTAPDIVGRGIANPVGQLWAAAMMLDHLGERDAAAALEHTFESVLASGTRTPDLGGTASTDEFTAAVLDDISAGLRVAEALVPPSVG